MDIHRPCQRERCARGDVDGDEDTDVLRWDARDGGLHDGADAADSSDARVEWDNAFWGVRRRN